MKLTNLIKENDSISHVEALKIANTKLKQLGLKPISEFNAGWTNHGDSPFETNISVPSELKEFVKSMRKSVTVSGDINYHSTYNPSPNITIKYWIWGFRYQYIKDTYTFHLGTKSFRYEISKGKWEETTEKKVR